MAIHSLHVAGYRSIRDLYLKMGPVNVLVGPNGCGKSNLYQSMYFLAAAARGELAQVFAEEGGLPSALWAGPRLKPTKHAPTRLTLRAEIDNLEYELRCGPPPPGVPEAFKLDPEVKEELIWFVKQTEEGPRDRIELLERNGGEVTVHDSGGRRERYPYLVANHESILANLRDPHRYPHISALAVELKNWRFYHVFRTDPGSPLREPQIGFRSPVLDCDAGNLAATLKTIEYIGDKGRLHQAIVDAFPGARLMLDQDGSFFHMRLRMPELRRPLEAREFSDGTLRYLCLLAALLSPRAPSLLALNEPETSLHPDLIDPLGRLIADASKFSQIWITTHSRPLAAAIEKYTGRAPVELEKSGGETRLVLPGQVPIVPEQFDAGEEDSDEFKEPPRVVRHVFD